MAEHTPIPQEFSKTILVKATAAIIWEVLTDRGCVEKWLLDDTISVHTDWRPGSPLVIRGILHGMRFENRGSILRSEPGKELEYSHLSSLSDLPDEPASYSRIMFRLEPHQQHISLSVTLRNFPSDSIYRHLLMYWNVTLTLIGQFAEAKVEGREFLPD